MAKTKGIFKRGRIYWITYTGVDGRQKWESTGSALKADAEYLLACRKKAVAEGTAPAASPKRLRTFTFAELAERYLPFVQTQRAYTSKKVFVDALSREFGAVKLCNFTLAMLEGYQSRRLSEPRPPVKEGGEPRPPVKPACVNRHLATLKHMFTKAVDWEMVSEDVAKRVRKVKLSPENNRRLRYLSAEECNHLLAVCDKHLKPIVTLALNTGCRRGEILGLKWENVDMKHGFIHLTETKSGKRREIPMNGTVLETLRGIVRRLDVPWVFVSTVTPKRKSLPKPGGSTLEQSTTPHREKEPAGRYQDIKRSFATACRKAGIRDFHFHDLRHTFASQLVMAGVDITTVSRLLGHASLTMTLRYSHLAPDHLKSAVDVLSRLHDSLHDNGGSKTKKGPR